MIAIVIALAVVSVGFNVAGPRLLGNATNDPVRRASSSKMLPPGATQAQAVKMLEAGNAARSSWRRWSRACT